MSRPRLVIVSNRLPVTVERAGHEFVARPSCGGLISALLPAFRDYGGCWIGWPGGDCDPESARVLRTECAPEHSLQPVFLTDSEQRCFYHGWSNEIIWPLFHDLQSRCNFDPEYWLLAREVNEKFADVVEPAAAPGDFIWVHDYHLMMLADSLRARGLRAKISYFHHIPFPSPDIFEKLPWRAEVLRALLQFSSIGMQTDRDRLNFLACVQRSLPDSVVEHAGPKLLVRAAGACTTLGTFPISIDYQACAEDAASPAVEAGALAIRRQLSVHKLVLGLDRLDYTKGILERLAAFSTLLHNEPSLRGQVTLLQVVVPSREGLPQYQQLKDSIERLVSQINGEFATPGWAPVSYYYRSVPRSELLALYRAADVAWVTPLKDGMNLVAKEFCATRVDETGVLVLSEFAGAAAELGTGALLVNPYDTHGMAAVLLRALHMNPSEQHTRMREMRRVIHASDVFEWCGSVIREAGFRGSRSKPLLAASPQPQLMAVARP